MSGAPPDAIADTSAVILLSRGDAQAERRLEGRNFAITFVTLAELRFGSLKANDQIAAWQRVLEVLTGHSMYYASAPMATACPGRPPPSLPPAPWAPRTWARVKTARQPPALAG